MSKRVERIAVVSRQFREDLSYWIETDRKAALRILEKAALRILEKAALRILDLMSAAMADPFGGIGKPEPLKFELAGYWSRRITQEHRLVYRVTADRIEFHQARYHYQ